MKRAIVPALLLACVCAASAAEQSDSFPHRMHKFFVPSAHAVWVIDSIPGSAVMDTVSYWLDRGISACPTTKPQGGWALAYEWDVLDRGPHAGFYSPYQLLELDQKVGIPDTTMVSVMFTTRLVLAPSVDSAMAVAKRLRPPEFPKQLRARALEIIAVKRLSDQAGAHQKP